MVSFSPEEKSLSNLTPVPVDAGSQDELAGAIDELLGMLAGVDRKDASVEQLRLETRWLKEDLEHGQLALPNNWELMLFEVARGEKPEFAKSNPSIAKAIEGLCGKISSQIRR